MMAQFFEIKEEYPTALLFYRMGDFYELFFDDAVAAAQALDITLTKRGKHLGSDIPMCGVPVHAAEGYLLNLIRKGFRVAVCEQLENPKEAKKRGAKSVVRRGVVRLVTPGTLTEDTLLHPRQSNFLAAFAQVRDQSCLAWLDISTGDVRYSPCPVMRLGPELARLAPAEVLISDTATPELLEVIADSGASSTPLAQTMFDSAAGVERLANAFGVSTLDGLGDFGRADIAALGALIEYLTATQKGQLPLLRQPQCEARDDFVAIDAATRRNLELTQTLSGEKSGSLLSVVDRSVTAAGARLLYRRVTTPSQRLDAIDERASSVQFFCENSGVRSALRSALKQLPDIERALGRLALERGGPRDLVSLGNGMTQAAEVYGLLEKHDLPKLLEGSKADLVGNDALLSELDQALVANPPLLTRDGGFVAAGYSAELDEVTSLRNEARSVIAGMQADYATFSGVTTLKIKHNNVLGYFIETTAAHAQRMLTAPLSETFIHRQTTANAVRFTTVNLGELETKILNAAGHATGLELEIFEGLCRTVLDRAAALQALAISIAEIDVASAFAELAMSGGWVRPILNNSRDFVIEQGRHPVVEAALKSQSSSVFVANDCTLKSAEDMIWLLTGPNMAGKSTFLRQNALIALLAQAGSYVPAARAEIGVVSQIFSRVGAADDLARGRSTFMVEMVETAAILNQADDRALVILDEIGRGTSTYDGLSIAWATLEHLHDVNRCRALFATHYHELTQLSAKLDHVDNATVTVREWQGDVVFLHEVKKGAADRSYGVQVAKLAGLPQSVLERARVVLEALERGEREGHSKQKALIDDLPLFSAVATVAPMRPSALEDALADVQPDALSPKEALDLIYALKAKLQN
ncbi:DNA mismatch repair protein MutS [uncultured Planktomarina sp.]|uniref:DNA mismatch repair protein MutS n=1 Tax=uncultured Planktomarina sp. TaxID=1538529 RepID=UPI003260E6CD